MDVHNRLPNRQTARLRAFDYAAFGAYFVTLCTHRRICILGNVADQAVGLTDTGMIVDRCWRAIPAHFSNVFLDTHVIMPNHIHGIIILKAPGATDHPIVMGAPKLGEIVRAFKARATFEARHYTGAGHPIWQRNYHERVIRNDEELNGIRQYIADNPKNWETDQENPAAFA